MSGESPICMAAGREFKGKQRRRRRRRRQNKRDWAPLNGGARTRASQPTFATATATTTLAREGEEDKQEVEERGAPNLIREPSGAKCKSTGAVAARGTVGQTAESSSALTPATVYSLF